jgi:hypothetical protein
MTSKIKLKVLLSTFMFALQYEMRKVKMATAILIVFNTPERGHSNGVFEKKAIPAQSKVTYSSRSTIPP